MRSRANRLGLFRTIGQIALLPPAAFAVHQLRYMLAFGSGASLELQRSGHAYMHSVVPWLVVALALAAGVFLKALGRALAGQTSAPRYTVTLTGLWLTCTAVLVAIYISQELLEGFVLTGHPAGLQGVFGYGGWWAIPSAASIGLVLAAVFDGARWVLNGVATRRADQRPTRQAPSNAPRPHVVMLAPMAPLAAGSSGRGPPA
jgi:hypothetical protein